MGWLRRIVAALFSTRARTTGTVAVMGLVGVSTYVGTTAIPSPAPATCDRTATTATFTTQVTAATAGQVVCLDAGNYGTWAPANFNKAITLVSTDGSQSASLFVTFNNGDGGVTFSKLNITGADLTGNPGPTSLTFRDNKFTGVVKINGPNNASQSNLLFDHNVHNDIDVCSGCVAGRISLQGSGTTGVTIRNSTFCGGDADGVNLGGTAVVEDSEFCEINPGNQGGTVHTDSIQFFTNSTIRRNYVHDSTDGIVAYDGASGATISDNVVTSTNTVATSRCMDIESDVSSTISHNTFGSTCAINLAKDSLLPAGTGTVVRDNIIANGLNLNGGTTTSSYTNNLVTTASGACCATQIAGTPTFVGGSTPTAWGQFKLTPGSAGHAAASDGLDIGIR
jgi:parallel beta-helix repeat protein